MIREIYLAGGCFWGVEKLFSQVSGVIQAISGYANGISENLANYKDILNGGTKFIETVRIRYDSEVISLENILFIYFAFINPNQKHRQGNDIGYQYQAGIYYTDDYSEKIIEKIIKIEKTICKEFYVDIKPLENFYMAEEYHQEYLTKNPNGYCHIGRSLINILKDEKISIDSYTKPSKIILKEKGIIK